ncbi:putative transcription regulator mTERF family [Medicago truncatula]|uniref:Putative transcription regulator mTERF family n=1 Tax=Medicago truncatula TaxID=3880 RepID=A0A396JAB3_MEDTR|nr:putative transcription regulator mTERF family [Medicago truncatula]
MLKKLFLSQNVVLCLITTKSTTPKFNNPLFNQHLLFPISLRSFCTSESDTQPFAVSYLVNKFGFSHESALKAFNNRQVRFNTPDNPDSVITFFQNHGFSHDNIRIIITKAPWLLSSQPHKMVLPKFQFLLSKGASSSDIIRLLTANPKILQSSLEKRIIPLFQLLNRFSKTNKDTIVCLIRNSLSFIIYPYHVLEANINLMIEFGVSDSNIARLLQTRSSIFGSTDLIKSLEEVKCLGFHPSKTTFGAALIAKKCSKKLWDEKVDVFKKWGWSDEVVIRVFRFQPNLLGASNGKINFLHKRIIPRASVLQFLLMKGLRKKNASLVTPFTYSEKLFLSKCVLCFKEESDYLLKLYEEKMKFAHTMENDGMAFTTTTTTKPYPTKRGRQWHGIH